MATRLYLQNVAAPYTPTTKRGAWDKATQNLARYLGPRPSGAATTVNVTPGSTTANTDVLWGRWISDPAIAAGSLAGTVQWIIGVLEANAACNGFWHIHIFVTAGDSDTLRGTLLTDSIGATEFTTTATGRGEGTKTLTSVSVSVGDRICIEVGYQASADLTTRSMTMNYGNAGTTDLTQGSTSVTTQPGWFEFSGADGLFYSPISSIVDDFSSGSYANPPWSGNYGSPTIVSGVARIPATSTGGTPNYAGAQADPPTQGYDLDSVYAKLITVPSSTGAVAETYTQLAAFDPGVAGTYVAWVYDAVAGKLCALNAVGYTDVTTRVELTLSGPTWTRIRRSGANLLWETSIDGSSWSPERTETAPSWTNYHNLGLLIEAARDGGSNDFAEWDNVNTVPPSGVAPTGLAAAVALGSPTLSQTYAVAPNGLAVATALGTPSVALPGLTPTGLAVAAQLGTPAVAGPGLALAPNGLAVAVALGDLAVSQTYAVAPTGLAVPATTGTPSLALPGVEPSGISVPAALGSPVLVDAAMAAAPDGIAVPVALGTPTVVDAAPGTVIPAGLAVAVTLGALTVGQTYAVAPDGLEVAAAPGTPTVTHALAVVPDGLTVAAALGTPTADSALTVTPDGLAAPAELGAPGTALAFEIALPGLAILADLGAPAVVQAFGVAPQGLAVPINLGALTVQFSPLGTPATSSAGILAGRTSSSAVTAQRSSTAPVSARRTSTSNVGG